MTDETVIVLVKAWGAVLIVLNLTAFVAWIGNFHDNGLFAFIITVLNVITVLIVLVDMKMRGRSE